MTSLIYSNRLTENVSMTVAGLQVPVLYGGRRMMSPNKTGRRAADSPECCNPVSRQHANRTAQQVYNGLAGMWLVEDDE